MSESKPVQVLYMEDDAGTARLVQRRLGDAGYVVDVARDGEEGVAMVGEGSYDVVMVDQTMPVYEGLEVIRMLASRGSLPPVVMLTGTGSERVAAEAMKLGARDYIVKDVDGGYLGLLPAVIERVLHQQQLLLEKEQAEEALRASEQRYRLLGESMDDMVFSVDRDNIFRTAGGARLRSRGLESKDIIGRSLDDIFTPERAEEGRRRHRQVFESGAPVTYESTYEYSGITATDLTTVYPIKSQDGTLEKVGVICRDITERKRAEESLRQLNRELALINQVGRALTSTLDPNEVLDTLLEPARSLLGVAACSIWLRDSETDELVCREAIGPHRDSVRGWRLAPGQGIAGWVAQSGESLIVPDARADERHFSGVDQRTGLPLRSILSVPLQGREKTLGVLQVLDTSVDRFSTADLELVEPIAASAAIAIENARLYEGARRDAETLSTLVQEVNHRIRNNLTAIIGLLYAELGRLGPEDRATVHPFVQRMVGQVHAMAVVHNLLASSEWASPQLSQMARQVLGSTLNTLPGGKHISFDVAPSAVRVTSAQARDLALMINELATNTIKYALRERDTARISIQITRGTAGHAGTMAIDGPAAPPREENEVVFEFRDDGPGYAEAVWQSKQYSTGLDMIQRMARETLHGELFLHNDDGAVATIRFPIDT